MNAFGELVQLPTAEDGAASRGSVVSPASLAPPPTPLGELDLLLTAQPSTSEFQTSVDVVGLAPVVKWSALFGPLVGAVAGDLSIVLGKLAKSLDTCVWQEEEVQASMKQAEHSLNRLISIRRQWWQACERSAEGMVKGLQGRGSAKRGKHFARHTNATLCLPWLGLTLKAYSNLPPAVKDNLWVGFANIQDRQAASIETAVALLKRMKVFAARIKDFLSSQFPWKQPHALDQAHTEDTLATASASAGVVSSLKSSSIKSSSIKNASVRTASVRTASIKTASIKTASLRTDSARSASPRTPTAEREMRITAHDSPADIPIDDNSVS
ncbi:hypothetical protein GNI_059010 [Gregarina niphandrodes]|uniref:Uncharacterized protein n=1 Tax=Gregarina niphandrodes TaxID=110365 RepID=A0A023B8L9_GRENI|nr:hypothetical protein GNI_059010 [Gregarina niphandrodes]EZG69240.1 hypothetical protein GNI_059010 [Gregarina niphandrodes]|eukprot:XP_011134455.1 hypothetical protein GNI_059010 [Gregarina niphandrodes]